MTLTADDNELLTRVEHGAPMGKLLRQNYWFPVALSQTLVADGAPRRVRLLGENYVAWRATDGRVGFFDERCPHRGVSLALARNEDNALRCIFHGWKFGVDGKVLDVPTEPNNAAEFCKGVPLKFYPAREAAGIVWAWLGAGEPAMFPEFEFLGLPPAQVYPIFQVARYNWVQSVEGGMDAAHVAVLHQDWLGALSNNGTLAAAAGKLAPVYEFEDRPGGFRYAAIRRLDDGSKHIRLNEFVAPWYCFIAAETGNQGDRTLNMSIPVDDAHVVYWTVRYNPFGPLSTSPYNPVQDATSWPPYLTAGEEQRWGQDRVAMQGKSFSGFHFPTTEDFAVAESQGVIADRTKEYLSSGDRAVVRVRNILIKAVRQFEGGELPAIAQHQAIPYQSVRPMSDIVAPSFDWRHMAA